jgi:hypothetical protein
MIIFNGEECIKHGKTKDGRQRYKRKSDGKIITENKIKFKHNKSEEKVISKVKIDISTECKICNKQLKSIPGLCSHLSAAHSGKSYANYLLEYYNIDIINLNNEYTKNEELNIDINKEKQLAGFKKYTDSIKGKTVKERLGEEGYTKFRESMKGVFTKDWFIKKYGEEIGLKKYDERSKNISKTSYFREYNKTNKNNWSKVSQELFWEIYKVIKNKYEKIYFAELNHECSCGIQSNNYDFVILDNKKIIEFNGDKFHANPNKFKEHDIPIDFIKKTAKEIWKQDEEKNNKAKLKGFDVKIIWESDYHKNKDKIILECLDFLYL